MFLFLSLKESRGQDRGQQGKGTFPRKVWPCGVYCPEDVGSSSSSETYSSEANACCPGGIGCSSARCCCHSQCGYEKVSPPLPSRGFVMIVHPPWQPPAKAMPGVEPPAKAMPMAAGMEPPAGMPRGPASSTDGVPVKAMPPVPVLPAPPATAVTTTMVVEAPGLVTKSALHPPLPECARSSGNGEPCPYNFESQCGYIYDRGDGILAIPDHTACYAPHSLWFSTTRYSGKCFRSYFGAGRSGRRVAGVRGIGRGVMAQSQQPETNVVCV